MKRAKPIRPSKQRARQTTKTKKSVIKKTGRTVPLGRDNVGIKTGGATNPRVVRKTTSAKRTPRKPSGRSK